MRKLFALLVALGLTIAPAFPVQAKTDQSKRVRHAKTQKAKRVVRRAGSIFLKRAEPAAKRTNRNRRNSYSKLKPRNIA